MYRKILLGFVLIIFPLSFRVSHANIRISEFVSDPSSGSEWVELWNDASSEADLGPFSWTELVAPGSETERESSPKNLKGIVPGQGFFIFELSSALNNAGDSISLYESGSLIDRVTFGKVNSYSKDLDAPSKGKSGALISGSWKNNQEPTKNGANSSSPAEENEDTNIGSGGGGGSLNSSSGQEDDAAALSAAKVELKMSVRNIAYVGIPLYFQGEAAKAGRQWYSGRYFWNFGDGDFREGRVINADKFTHTYFYPGDYTVIFEHYPDSFAEEPDASVKTTIKVIDAKVSISRTGTAPDFFVELSNNTGYDVDISGWALRSAYKNFTIPKNTIIGASKKMIIAGRTSGLAAADMPSLELAAPGGETVFAYYAPQAPARAPRSIGSAPKAPTLRDELPLMPEAGPAAQNFGATPALAGALGLEGSADEPPPFLISALSVILVGAGAFAVYFLRKKRAIAPAGEDFEILDE